MEELKNEEFVDEQTFEEALENLVDNGYVHAICDTCSIPIDKDERKKSKCRICGPIKNIYYQLNEAPSC